MAIVVCNGMPARRPQLTLAILSIAAVSYVLQQTLVVPALPTIQRDLDTTNTWVTWVFTGFLLTSAVATPLLGKLGDIHGKRRLLVISMLVFVVGTVGRGAGELDRDADRGAGAAGRGRGDLPAGVRDHPRRVPAGAVGVGLGLLSATFGVGGGVGLVLSGVILEHLPWTWLFWIGAIPPAIALVLVWLLVPESPVRTPARLDPWGALTLSVGLAALLRGPERGRAVGLAERRDPGRLPHLPRRAGPVGVGGAAGAGAADRHRA